MAIYVALKRLLVVRFLIQYRHWGPTPKMMGWAAIEYTTRISLARIDDILDTDQNIPGILRSVSVPYLRGLPNSIFQQCKETCYTSCYRRLLYTGCSIVTLASTVSRSVTD
ncbi:hypothetical protein TNCV_2700341 [Trichonephila clavipes]|nr:hypothetical protein TNCV_2700341 [Trichonephila clavipes]